MKRVVALAMGLLLLTGCGAGVVEEPAQDIHWVASEYPHLNERFPLYVELPEDDIQLYGVYGENYLGGMVLFHENRETYFGDWGFAKYDLPCIAYYDFDGNGTRDIGVITLTGGGTFLFLSDLHIVTVHREERFEGSGAYDDYVYAYVDHAFTNDDVATFFNKGLKAKRGKLDNTIEFSFGGKTWTAELEDELLWVEEEGVQVGADGVGHIGFAFEEKGIRLRATPYVKYEKTAVPGYLRGEFTADVSFDGKEFHLTNIDYVPHAPLED